MLSFEQYKRKVLLALAPLKVTRSDLQLQEDFRDYEACVEILGYGDISVERTDDGDVRILVGRSERIEANYER